MRNLLIGVVLGLTAAAPLAQRGNTPLPDAVRADSAHYSVSFENELVRLLRVNYPAGERSVMHRHPASCVVFLTDQVFDFTLPDGTTEPATVDAGALGCSDSTLHLPENIGKAAAEFIMIEFNNRETFRK